MLPARFRFIWPSGFRGEDFRNQPIRNKNCLGWPCLLTDWDEINNLDRGPSIDASCQVSVHLTKWFQRRRLKCEKITDDGRRTPSDGKSSLWLWQGELKKSFVSHKTPQFYKNMNEITKLWKLPQKIAKLWMKLQNYENYPKNYKNMNGIISFIQYTFNTQI